MVGPLLETKLHTPRRRRDLVARPRLNERLSHVLERTLTLVSAGAGFGKTTLLTAWLAATSADGPVAAWLSLDERDNDPVVFYVAAALHGRTEGWIAGLRLAALSLQGRDDVAGFVARFAGDDRYIVDYLTEEVLQRQLGDVQRFLLQTSILDRLCAALCDAVTGQAGGNARLAAQSGSSPRS